MEEHIHNIDDLKIIKNLYGEKMSHKCRELFPTILEKPGVLSEIICSSFAPSRFLYEDIMKRNNVDNFKNFVFSKLEKKKRKIEDVTKTPTELLKEAGYTLYECKTEEDIQSFRKYYASGEELCTFNGKRLERCFVFFAVKDNVEEIKRENFSNPEREDEYGTSVISIQFSRGENNTLSIKNRYNHKVNNPDATFSNNLDNIIPGLNDSFNNYYGFNYDVDAVDFDLYNYVKANDGKFYRYNYEINNIYYCPDNIIIDHFDVRHFDKEKYIIMDYFIIDKQKESRSLKVYDSTFNDSFPETVGDIYKIEERVDKDSNTREITINDNITIVINQYNQIKEYYNSNIIHVPDNFLINSHYVTVADIPNVEYIGNYFMYRNTYCEDILLPKLKEVGDKFMVHTHVKDVYFPSLEKIGSSFMNDNYDVVEIDLPSVKIIKDHFISYGGVAVKSIYLPEVEEIGECFLTENLDLREISLPNVKRLGSHFLCRNNDISRVYLPKAEFIGHYFMRDNYAIEELDLPNVEIIENLFLIYDRNLKKINIPKLRNLGHDFLPNAKKLEYINDIKIERWEKNIEVVQRIIDENTKKNSII